MSDNDDDFMCDDDEDYGLVVIIGTYQPGTRSKQAGFILLLTPF